MMDIFADVAEVPRGRAPLCLAIGAFDGVHLGHQAVIRAAGADAGCGAWGVMTFDPDPAHALATHRAPPVITPRERALEIMADIGVQIAVVLPFTRAFAEQSAEIFVRDRLARPGTVGRVCVGRDFRYGRGARGNIESLRASCEARGIRVQIVAPVTLGGSDVSSSRIRALVGAGDLAAAARLLGRPFSVWGRVEHGRRLGSTIGIPTANLLPGNRLVPPCGVYAAATRVADAWYGSAVNIGIRPTVANRAGGPVVLESHLLDFDGHLGGRAIEVVFGPRIRDERRFDGLPSLQRRIAEDIGIARRWWEASRADAAAGWPWTGA